MSKERLIAWAGPLTISVGLLWVVASLEEFVVLVKLASMEDAFWGNLWAYPIALSFILMVPAFIGIRLRHQEAAGGVGRLGLALSVAGCGGMCLFVLVMFLMSVLMLVTYDEPPDWPLYVMSACVLTVMTGHNLFGIDTLRNKPLPRWNALPLLVGLPTLLLIVPTLILESHKPRTLELVLTTTFLPFAITGTCWVLLGCVMLDRRQSQVAVSGV